MMGYCTLQSDTADPIVTVTMGHAVLLDLQVKLSGAIQIQCAQVMVLPSQVPHVSSGVGLLNGVVVKQNVHSSVTGGLTGTQL